MNTPKKLLVVMALIAICPIASGQTVPSYIPKEGLLGWYPFNGNANDESGNGKHGTLMNGVALTADRFGMPNSAFFFDGIDDFIWLEFLSALNGAQKATLSYWAYNDQDLVTDPNIPFQGLFGHWKHDGQFSGPIGLQVQHYKNLSIHTSLIGGKGSTSTANVASTLNWENFTIVFDGSLPSAERVSLYKDGEFIQKIVLEDVPSAIGVQATRTYIGAACGPVGPQSAYSFFNGKIDDVGVWNTALTAQQIKSIYSSNVGINVSDPKRNLHIKDVIRLEPRNSAPQNPQKGDIYFDGVLNKLRAYDGTNWRDCW